MIEQLTERGRSGRRRRRVEAAAPVRAPDYRRLSNTFESQPAFSEDRVEAIHTTALRVLEELGIRVLHDEARACFAESGAEVAEDMMVRIDRGLVEQALSTARAEFEIAGGVPGRSVRLGGGQYRLCPRRWTALRQRPRPRQTCGHARGRS